MLVVVTLAETGGAQTYVAHLLPALCASFDVTVAAHGDGPLAAAVEEAGATLVPLEHLRRPLSPVGDLRAVLELWRLCRRVRPRLVHLNSSKAVVIGTVAAWLARVPVRLVTVHGWPFKTETGIRKAIYAGASRAVRPLVTRAICVAENERTVGIAAHAIRPSQAVVIHNGVEIPEAASAPTGRDVVTVTRLRPPKDTTTLVAAAARVRDLFDRLLVVGDGPDRPEVERLVSELGLDGQVELLGDRDDVDAILARASVFVLSSRSEGLPMAVLEAMAAGVPTIASNVGGIPEVVNDGADGVLVAPGDAHALADALRRLLDDAELRLSMGRKARERARASFGLDHFREAHVALYDELLAERRTA